MDMLVMILCFVPALVALYLALLEEFEEEE